MQDLTHSDRDSLLKSVSPGWGARVPIIKEAQEKGDHEKGYPELVQVLRDISTNELNVLFLYAVQINDSELVDALLCDNRTNPRVCNDEALKIAQKGGFVEIEEFLWRNLHNRLADNERRLADLITKAIQPLLENALDNYDHHPERKNDGPETATEKRNAYKENCTVALSNFFSPNIDEKILFEHRELISEILPLDDSTIAKLDTLEKLVVAISIRYTKRDEILKLICSNKEAFCRIISNEQDLENAKSHTFFHADEYQLLSQSYHKYFPQDSSKSPEAPAGIPQIPANPKSTSNSFSTIPLSGMYPQSPCLFKPAAPPVSDPNTIRKYTRRTKLQNFLKDQFKIICFIHAKSDFSEYYISFTTHCDALKFSNEVIPHIDIDAPKDIQKTKAPKENFEILLSKDEYEQLFNKLSEDATKKSSSQYQTPKSFS